MEYSTRNSCNNPVIISFGFIFIILHPCKQIALIAALFIGAKLTPHDSKPDKRPQSVHKEWEEWGYLQPQQRRKDEVSPSHSWTGPSICSEAARQAKTRIYFDNNTSVNSSWSRAAAAAAAGPSRCFHWIRTLNLNLDSGYFTVIVEEHATRFSAEWDVQGSHTLARLRLRGVCLWS